MHTEVWYAVQYNEDPDDDPLGWADTYHGDHFDDLPAARQFAANWDMPSAVRVVKRTQEVIGDDYAEPQPTREQRALDELRTLLRDWREYDDTALVDLVEKLLIHYGYFGDEDHIAAQERRRRFTDGVDPELCAYDGQNEPQKRALTGRERDILCRVLHSITYPFRSGRQDEVARVLRAVRVHEDDVELLELLTFVLNPRDN